MKSPLIKDLDILLYSKLLNQLSHIIIIIAIKNKALALFLEC